MTLRLLTVNGHRFNTHGGVRRLIIPRKGGRFEVVCVRSDGRYAESDSAELQSDDIRFALAKVLLGVGGHVVEYVDSDAIVRTLALKGKVCGAKKVRYLPQDIPYGCLESALKVHRSGQVPRTHVHLGWGLHGKDTRGNGAGWSCHTWLTAPAGLLFTSPRQIVECHAMPGAYLGFDTHYESDPLGLLAEWAKQLNGGDLNGR